MPASGLALALSVASLKLCSDEYLLLLADPGQIASVSYLAREPLESPLWRRAKPFHANRGSVEDVLATRPGLILTMGGTGRSSAVLARRLGLKVIDLPVPADVAGVARNLATVGRLLGQQRRAAGWVTRLTNLQATRPPMAEDAIWLSGGGLSLSPGIGTEWLRLAGFLQRPLPQGRATLETILTKPPKIFIRSNYRSGQMSAGVRWLDHPIVRRSSARTLVTDGRPWTCMGPLMIAEIERLRKAER